MPGMEIEALALARFQFAFTIAFHILFPTLTIGLSLFLLAFEIRWLRTGQDVWFRLYRFWSKIFGLAFGLGVVTGIVLSFQFGTNWSRFSFVAGEVIGPLHGYEVLTAFFLEAGFLGIMLFGWHRVPKGLHLTATAAVAFGTVLSAFWILSANSWMQTPAGTEAAADGRLLVVSWWAVIFNPSFPYRLAHMVTAGLLTATFFVLGVSALQIKRHRDAPQARHSFSMALWAAALLAPLQVALGDLHGLNTLEHQPIKVAAMEGNWQTRSHAPLLLFAWPDQAAAENRYEIGIPSAGSLILRHEAAGIVPGLTDVPPAERPPVAIVFFAFRVMVGIGFLLLTIAVLGLVLRRKGAIFRTGWFHNLCLATMPLGFVATLAGWIVTEVGRQPWIIQGVLRTADAASPVGAGQVGWSLALFVIVYNVLLIALLYYLFKVIRKGPDYEELPPWRPDGDQRPMGARTAWVTEPEGK